MKVLRLIPVLDFGGVESRFTMQARLWSAPDIHVEYCTFWHPGAAAERLHQLGAKVRVLKQNPAVRNPKATLALLRLLRELRPDVVHSSIGEANFHNMFCAPWGPWKTIIEEAGIPNRKLRNRLVHGALYRACDRIVAVSPASADYMIDHEWAPKDRVQVIPNAIRTAFYEQPREHRRLAAPRLFRAVGRLAAVKNYAMLIRAFAKAHQTAPHIRLEIAGDGEERPALEALIRELHAEDFIALRGFVSDVAELHRDTDFFLMPSLSEGFGLAAAEPMAMGIPGYGSRVGGLFTVFGELADDWLLDATDEHAWAQGITRLAELTQAAYEDTSRRFMREATRFSPQRYIADLEALYRSVGV